METSDIISISQFKATCLAVLEKVRKTGQAVLVTKHGKPIAQINPPPLPDIKRSWLGSMRNTGKIIGDVVSPAASDGDWRVVNE